MVPLGFLNLFVCVWNLLSKLLVTVTAEVCFPSKVLLISIPEQYKAHVEIQKKHTNKETKISAWKKKYSKNRTKPYKLKYDFSFYRYHYRTMTSWKSLSAKSQKNIEVKNCIVKAPFHQSIVFTFTWFVKFCREIKKRLSQFYWKDNAVIKNDYKIDCTILFKL